jgi:hypothetical protein
MIISEQQVMQLIMIARNYADDLLQREVQYQVMGFKITQIINEIMCQQSKELKEIE